MGSRDQRAFETVVLARAFEDSRGRAHIAAIFPSSVVALFDAVTAHPGWAAAHDLTGRALVVARVLDEDPALEALYQADVDAGLLGFGAGEDDEIDTAIRNLSDALEPRAGMQVPDLRLPEMQLPEVQLPDVELAPVAGAGAAPIDAGDGLLGEDGATDAWVPDLPVVPLSRIAPIPGGAERAVSTWLNAELDNEGKPLEVLKTYPLAVSYGEQNANAVAGSPVTLIFPQDEQSVELTIQLVSNDFRVPKRPQTLAVTVDGRSDERALFEVTPLHAGPSTLAIVVNVKGNFLQRLDVTWNVSGAGDIGDAGTAPEVTSYGRPVGAASVLASREAVLEFKPAAGGYQLRAPQLYPDRFIDVFITADELAARIEGVRSVLLKWVKKRPVALKLDLTPEDNAAMLKELAQAGFRLFQAIFRGPESSAELKEVGVWLRESLSGDVTTLQVVSKGFPVPWPLMYLAERFAATPLSWDNFIGMRHVVEQVRLTENKVVPPMPAIESTPDLSVRVLYNDGIDLDIPSKPVAEQRRYWSGQAVALTEGTSVEDLMGTALAATAADKVLYLYCHAEASLSDPDASKLIFTGSTSVTLGDLWALAPDDDQLASRPLVFLNACESADMTPNFYDGFVQYFAAKGARGVIGTECKTPGLFASEWAKAFFDDFFAGKPLGDVVLELRRRFLTDHNNPLGLLYGVHCDTDTVVTPALAAQAR